jgi:hypothetical protein
LVAVCNCTCNLDSGLTGTSLTLPAEQSSICQLAQEDLIDSGWARESSRCRPECNLIYKDTPG